MQALKFFFLLLFPIVLLGCSGSDGGNDGGEIQELVLDLQTVDPGQTVSLDFYDPRQDSPPELNTFTLGNSTVQFATNVAYDTSNDTVFDIFLPESDEPTPLVIYIHGGSFLNGDKSRVYGSFQEHLQEALDNGVAYATINYRLLNPPPEIDNEGVWKSLNDSKRALQFIRHYAEQLNINPDQIAIYGASAGAGTALWLAFHNDMAGEGNGDAIDQQSTRISAVGAIETQATYDLLRWEQQVLSTTTPFAVTLAVAKAVNLEQLLLNFYGIRANPDVDTYDVLATPEAIAYRADVDMLGLMTVEDPPMWVGNYRIKFDLIDHCGGLSDGGCQVDWIFHHPLHAEALHDQAQFIGIESVAYYALNDEPFEDPSEEKVIPFMIRHIDF